MATKAPNKSEGLYAKASQYIGKTVLVEFQRGFGNYDKVEVKMRILDYKNSYGKNRYLAEPIAGTGKIWVENFKPA